MKFKSPFTDEETARAAGRQALVPLVDAIRCTVAEIIKGSEEAHTRLLMLSCQDKEKPIDPSEIDKISTIHWDHANLLVNIVLALDEHKLYRGHQAVEDWLTGGNDE